MIVIIILILTGLCIGYWYLINKLLFKNRNYEIENELQSIRALGLFTTLNVWPAIVGINQFGIYIIETSWHGLKQKKQFFPIETIVLVRVVEYIGLFGKIEILLRFNSMQNDYFQIPQFYTINKCNKFYKQWLIAQKAMYHS